MSDIGKKGFIEAYIGSTLSKKVQIKNIYASIDDFDNCVKTVKKLKFVQVKNLITTAPGSSFEAQCNIYGFDAPKKISSYIDFDNVPWAEIRASIRLLEQKRNNGELEKVVLVGHDDSGVEQSFDFRNLIHSIEVIVDKNEDKMLDNKEVQTSFLNHVG